MKSVCLELRMFQKILHNSQLNCEISLSRVTRPTHHEPFDNLWTIHFHCTIPLRRYKQMTEKRTLFWTPKSEIQDQRWRRKDPYISDYGSFYLSSHTQFALKWPHVLLALPPTPHSWAPNGSASAGKDATAGKSTDVVNCVSMLYTYRRLCHGTGGLSQVSHSVGPRSLPEPTTW